METPIFIAIISRDLATNLVQRSAFTGSDKDAVIGRALLERDRWVGKGYYGPYRIFAGVLIAEVLPKVPQFEEVFL